MCPVKESCNGEWNSCNPTATYVQRKSDGVFILPHWWSPCLLRDSDLLDPGWLCSILQKILANPHEAWSLSAAYIDKTPTESSGKYMKSQKCVQFLSLHWLNAVGNYFERTYLCFIWGLWLSWGWLPHYVVDLTNYSLLNMLRWLGLVQLQAGLSLGLQEKLQILFHLLQLKLVVHNVQALLDDLLAGALVVPWRGGCQGQLLLLQGWLQHVVRFHLLEMAQLHSRSWGLQRSLWGARVNLLNLVGHTSTGLLQPLGREGLSHPPGHVLGLRARLLLQPGLQELPRLGSTPGLSVLVLQAVLQGEVLLLKCRRLVEALMVVHVLVRRLGLAWVRDAEAVGAAHGCRWELVWLAALQMWGWRVVPMVQGGL